MPWWWQRQRPPLEFRPAAETMDRVDKLATDLLRDSAELRQLVRNLRAEAEDEQ